MGFETQEEAERYAENVEFLADQRREEMLLATPDERAAEAAWIAYSAGLKAYQDAKHPFLKKLTEAAFKRGYLMALQDFAPRA